MPDKRLEPRSSGKHPRKYKFIGTHDNLVTGKLYTLREISILTGIKNNLHVVQGCSGLQDIRNSLSNRVRACGQSSPPAKKNEN